MQIKDDFLLELRKKEFPRKVIKKIQVPPNCVKRYMSVFVETEITLKQSKIVVTLT